MSKVILGNGGLNKAEGSLEPEAASPDVPGKLIVRGPLLRRPLSTIGHFIFKQEMMKGMQTCQLTEFNVLQKSVIPHFLRGDDCLIVGGPRCGKTLSYLIPMIGTLIKAEPVQVTGSLLEKRGGGALGTSSMTNAAKRCSGLRPLAILVHGDKKSAVKTEGFLIQLLSFSNQRHLTHYTLTERQELNKLKSADVLVTTAHFLCSVIENRAGILAFDNLRFMVYDDIDSLLQTFRKEFDRIQETVVNIAAKRSSAIQRIFCGQEWSDDLEEFYLNSRALSIGDDDAEGSSATNGIEYIPTVFINSANQIVRYSKAKLTLKHCSTGAEKSEYLIELLRSNALLRHRSIFILCAEPSIVHMIAELLKENDVRACTGCSDNFGRSIKIELKDEWDNFPVERRIMILDDDAARDLGIYDVTCVIHYDIHSKNAMERFQCIWSNVRDITEEKTKSDGKFESALDSYILSTGNEPTLQKLVKFVLKTHGVVSESLVDIANEMERKMLEKVPLCEGLKHFGRCVELISSNCKRRHTFLRSDLEMEPVIPRSGEIEVSIAECVNPSLYTGRVLRLYDYKNGIRVLKTSLIHKFNEISLALTQHFETERKPLPPMDIIPGTICAVRSTDGDMCRARIRKIYTRENDMPKHLSVFCIDTGHYIKPLAKDLFPLPSTMQVEAMPQLAVELILANLEPMDRGKTYSSSDTNEASNFTLDKIFNGKVQFAMGETVWVNPLVDKRVNDPDSMLSENNCGGSRSTVRLHLINKRCAQPNESHMKNIIDLCRQTGYKCLELEEMENNPAKDPSFMSQFHDGDGGFQWAFATRSTEDDPDVTEVRISFTKNPHCIMAVNTKFEDLLEELTNELHEDITNFIATNCSNYAIQFQSYYQVGMPVAVNDKIDQRWVRGLVVKREEKGDIIEFTVFLSDIGEIKNVYCVDLFPIPKKLVKQLPFQAMAFSLSHVAPIELTNKWDNKTIGRLRELTLDDGVGLELTVVVLGAEEKEGKDIPCRYYAAVILDDKDDDIGQLLVQERLARFRDSQSESIVKSVKSILLEKYNKIVERTLSANTGNDDDEGSDDDNSDDDKDKFDVVGFDQKLFESLSEEFKTKTQLTPESVTDNTNGNAAANQNCETSSVNPATTSSASPQVIIDNGPRLNSPKVNWKQSVDKFVLIVDHPDIKDYKIEIKRKNISFRTLNPPDYGFDIQCYSTIENTADVFLTGQYLRITIKKRTKWLWPRPLTDAKAPRWLKQDMDTIVASDSEDDDDPHPLNPSTWDEAESDTSTDVEENEESFLVNDDELAA